MFRKEDIKRGIEITCRISDTVVNSAKIQIQNDMIYICQDMLDGDQCMDKFGYRYSWSVGILENFKNRTVKDFFLNTNVSNVKLKEEPEWDTEKN